MRLVLWDIDHTLISTRGVGRELSGIAFERATGTPMRQQAKIDGITEAVIFAETAKLHGLTTSRADFERFADALAAVHVEKAAELRERGHALPGAAAAIEALAAVPGTLQTVVTGNVRPVAEIKLATFGLDRRIVWDAGAYGEDADERADLVRISLARAEAVTGTTIPPLDVVLLGDTPADVEAAVAVGVRVVAVASGKSSQAELKAAGADHVLADLTNTDEVLRLVASAT